MTDEEIRQARERANVLLSGVEGRLPASFRRVCMDVVALADALDFAGKLLDEELPSE